MATEEILRRLDEEIEATPDGHIKLQLKTRRNSLIPFSRLFEEIISLIFLTCAQDLPRLPDCWNKKQAYGWLRVAQVCKHWRCVALNTATLWSRLWFRKTKLADMKTLQEFTRRSKRALLHVLVDQDGPRKIAAIFRLLMPEISRVRELTMRLPIEAYRKFESQFPTSVPALRSLDMARSDSCKAVAPQIPIFLTRCTTPYLESLSVHAYSIPWTAGVLPPSLKSLSVVYWKIPETVPVDTVLHVLRGLPLLESLTLSSVLRPETVPSSSALLPRRTNACPMPHLYYLVLFDTLLTCLHFLDHLALPIGVKVELHDSDRESRVELASALAAVLSRTLASSENAGVVEWLHLGPNLMKLVCRHARTTANATELNVMCRPNHLFFCTVPLLPLHNLKELDFFAIESSNNWHHRPIDPHHWRDSISRMRTVETLWLDAYHDPAVFSDITTDTQHTPPDPTTVALPNVRRIYVVNCSFDGDLGSKKSCGPRLFTECLRRMLEVRQRNGARVEELILKDCNNLRESDIASLREVVHVEVIETRRLK